MDEGHERIAEFDVAVVGGGIAGAFCAALLSPGCRVALIEVQAGRSRADRLEGVSARSVAVLRAHAMQHALAALGPWVPRHVCWQAQRGNALAHVTEPTRSMGGEFLARRPALDKALRKDALAVGVKLIHGRARIKHGPSERQAGGYHTVSVLTAEGPRKLRARWLVDARGRAAEAIDTDQQPGNLALGAWLSDVDARIQGAGGNTPATQLQALQQGWLWLANQGEGATWVQLTAEWRKSTRCQLQQELHDALKQVGIAGRARLSVARTAGFRLGQQADLAAGYLPIGDAAAAYDPLSGQGIFWALSSALQAVAMLRSLLSDAGADMQALCAQFHHERVLGNYRHQLEVGAAFYQMAQGQGPFWQKRARLPAHAVATNAVELAGKRWFIESGPVVRDGRVVRMSRLRQAEGEPIAFVGELAVADIIDTLGPQLESAMNDEHEFQQCLSAYGTTRQSQQLFHWLKQNPMAIGATRVSTYSPDTGGRKVP